MHLTLCNIYKYVTWLLHCKENKEILRYIRKIHYTCADFNHEYGNTKCEIKKKYKVWNKKKKKKKTYEGYLKYLQTRKTQTSL